METTEENAPAAEDSSSAECQVTVKTLDSQNHVFTISPSMGIKDFKEEISGTIGIPADQQRLIFRGRVLQDDKKIKDYNVENNTIHVVQRPTTSTNSRGNDEPRAPAPGGHNHNAAVLMGTIGLPNIDIQSQHNPLGGFGRRAGASVRLQVSNRMLTQASSLLRRLEEDETISLEVPAPETPAVQAVVVDPATPPENNAEATPTTASATTAPPPTGASTGGRMDVDGEQNNSLGRIISQVANAATAASIIAAIRQNSGDPAAPEGATPGQANSTTADPSQRRPDIPAPPRLREMAVVIQDILTFQERLGPYLQFIQNTLQLNRQYEDLEEQQSTQFVFDTVSSILHYLSHSYHAMSDIICDFSTPAETRRLRAATAILVEQSTVVRATIPIATTMASTNPRPTTPAPTSNTTPPTPANNTTTPTPTPPTAATAANNPTLGTNTTTGNPMMNMGPQMQQLFANLANSGINFGGGGGAGGGGGVQEIHVNIGQAPPQGQQGQGQPQGIPIMTGIPGVSVMMGLGTDPAGMNLGGAQGGMNFNLQDLSAMLGPAMGGIMPMFNNAAQQQQQNSAPQNQNQNLPRTGPPTTTATATTTGTNPSVGMNNNATGGLQYQMSPFDLLLNCSSHHGSRNPQSQQRPANFRNYVNVTGSPSEGLRSTPNEDFAETLINTLFYSNMLPLIQPVLQDIIANYLMRGRDPKNKDHVRSCARNMGKKLSTFLESFCLQIAGRLDTISYSETFTNLLTIFLTELMHITATSSNSDFKNGILSACETFVKDLLSVLRTCLPTGNDGWIRNLASFIVERVLAGTSLTMRENAAKRLHDYFLSVGDPSRNPPPSVITYKQTTNTNSTTPASAGPSAPTPTPTTRVPVPAVSPRSAAVLPPKQSKPNPPSESQMDEDIDDDLLNMRMPPPPMPSMRRGPPPINPHNIEAMLRTIPSDWVETARTDFMRQLGMPEQPPFSPGYVALLSRRS